MVTDIQLIVRIIQNIYLLYVFKQEEGLLSSSELKDDK